MSGTAGSPTTPGFPPGVVQYFGIFAAIVTPVMVAALYLAAVYQTLSFTPNPTTALPPLNPVLVYFEPLFLGTMTGTVAWGLGQPKPSAGSGVHSQLHSLMLSSFGTKKIRGRFDTDSGRAQIANVTAVLYLVLYFGLALLGGIVWYFYPNATPDLVKTLPTLAVGALLAAANNAVKA